MNSITLYTEEIDELREAVDELAGQLGDFRFLRNTLGIVHVEEDTEYDRLYELLRERFDFPIVGCTAMALLLGKQGFRGMGIGMMILTADDCEFSMGMTEELDIDNYKEEIDRTYRKIREKLPSDPKLVLTYGGVALKERDVPGDDLVAAIDACAGGIPIFGALASDSYTLDKFRVFCNERSTMHGQAMVLISGNIEPKFATNNSVDNRSMSSYVITKSKSNHLMELGNGSFLDMLQRENMASEKENVIRDYILSPFVLTLNRPNGDSIEIARTLSRLDHEQGSGSFLGVVPEGAVLSIGLINRSDVQKSVEMTIRKILDFLEKSGDRYHTLICTSCSARFFALAGNTAAEAETFINRLPEGVSLFGLYGNGEICPIEGDKTGTIYNFYHNFTFTVMAI